MPFADLRLIRRALAGPVLVGLVLAGAEIRAGEADVLKVTVHELRPGVYRFDVTVRHADSGWDHYANRWEVLAPDGTRLGERVLAHPHVDEQPFTRSSRIRVPAGVSRVRVRAHDSVHGPGGREHLVVLPE